MIKNLKLLFVCVAVIGMVSCSEDDGGGGGVDPNASLVGTWTGTDINYAGTSSTTVQGQTFTVNYDGVATEFNGFQIVFNNDGTVSSSGGYTIELTTESQGQSVSQEYVIDNAGFTGGTYVQNGNTVTITVDDQTIDYTIVQLTANTLEMTADANAVGLGQSGATTDVIAHFTFSRN